MGMAVVLRRNLATALAPLVVLALASLSFRVWFLNLHDPGWVDSHAFLLTTLLGTFHWFAAGMALAILSVRRISLPIGDRGLMVLAAGCFLLAVFGPATDLFQQVMATGIGVALVGLATTGSTRAVRAVLGNPLLVWLGLVSYGIYLWQFPLVRELSHHGVDGFVPLLLSGFAVVVPAAAVSYYLVEQPAIRLKDGRPSALRARLRPR